MKRETLLPVCVVCCYLTTTAPLGSYKSYVVGFAGHLFSPRRCCVRVLSAAAMILVFLLYPSGGVLAVRV